MPNQVYLKCFKDHANVCPNQFKCKASLRLQWRKEDQNQSKYKDLALEMIIVRVKNSGLCSGQCFKMRKITQLFRAGT